MSDPHTESSLHAHQVKVLQNDLRQLWEARTALKASYRKLESENRQLREECSRLAPLWADYSEDVTVAGCVVRAHPCDVDKITEALNG